MVDERAMSTVKWINGPRRGRQTVGTVSDHLIIRGWNTIQFEVGFQPDKQTWYSLAID